MDFLVYLTHKKAHPKWIIGFQRVTTFIVGVKSYRTMSLFWEVNSFALNLFLIMKKIQNASWNMSVVSGICTNSSLKKLLWEHSHVNDKKILIIFLSVSIPIVPLIRTTLELPKNKRWLPTNPKIVAGLGILLYISY